MASKKPTAGELRGLFSFQQRGAGNDGFPGSPDIPGTGPMTEVFKSAGRLTPMRGGEGITAGRLEGRQPYFLTFRSHTLARTIDTSWQVVDVRNNNKVYHVKSPISDADMHNQWLDMLVQEGGVE